MQHEHTLKADSPHLTLSEPLTATVQFQSARPDSKMLVSFGVRPGGPMITVYHGDEQAVVEIWRDGTCKLNEQYLDEAARTFYKAVASEIQLEQQRPGFVVRKKGVSEYMMVRRDEVDWTQNVDHATHFARQIDAEISMLGVNEEVVPAVDAMNFERFRGLV